MIKTFKVRIGDLPIQGVDSVESAHTTDHTRGRDLDPVLGIEITDQDHATEEGGSGQDHVRGDQDHGKGDQDHITESTDQDQDQRRERRVGVTASLKERTRALLINISTNQNKT